MNERILELANQAGIQLPDESVYNGHIYQNSIERFAKLLVNECISCVGSQADKAYLKKHFGLPVESDIIYPAVEESWSVETQYKREVLK